MLQVVDPATEEAQNKLRKVDFIEDFKKLWKDLYLPQKHVAKVKCRHRSGFRQFIKDKPTKWGIKLCILADSSNCYTLDFNIYIGRAAGQTICEHGLGYDVDMRLMAPYFEKGYHLFETIFTPPLPFLNIFKIRVSLPQVHFQAGVVSHPLLKTAKRGLTVGSGEVCAG